MIHDLPTHTCERRESFASAHCILIPIACHAWREAPTRSRLDGTTRLQSHVCRLQLAEGALQAILCDQQIKTRIIAIGERDDAQRFCVEYLIIGA